ncbi:ABC transporter permease [Massilia forsythiae]|nr:ABC transporter permease [Massilia forsythiae]
MRGGAGVLLLALLVVAALGAPWLASQNPYDLAQLDLMNARVAAGALGADGQRFMLGTDGQGRDMLSAILYGLRISLFVGTASTALALLVGLPLGLLAGYGKGAWGGLVMRIADLQLSFPPILVALVLLALGGPGAGRIVLALATVQWAYYARTIRGVALGECAKDYMHAAAVLGLPHWRILFRHLLPNCLPPIIVVATVQMASAISLEATLSFLGVGMPVTEPSLGLLIANGFEYLLSGSYWISYFPGLALLLLIVSIHLVADHVHDLFDPRARGQRGR